MAPKDEELRPVMTRIPEKLRRRLEREAKWHRRSMNAEIVNRLQQSFDIPDQAREIASDVASEIETELREVDGTLGEIQSQIRAILSHLGLPDPVEEAKAREAETRKARAEARKAAMEQAEAARRSEPGSSKVLDGEKE
jgi:hypothetical protein